MRARLATLTTLSALALAALGAGNAQAVTTYDYSFGSSGTGAGEFDRPTGVAINTTTGDIYVADENNNRIQQFDSAGNFIRMWGKDVDLDDGSDFCTAAEGHTCQAGAPDDGAGELRHPRGIAVDSISGAVYVQDALNNRIQKFEADGTWVLTWGKAVDQQGGDNICAADEGHTCQAGGVTGVPGDPDLGVPAIPTEDGTFQGWHTSGGDPASGPTVGVDADGNVYVTDYFAIPAHRIQKFNSEGEFLGEAVAGDDLSSGDNVRNWSWPESPTFGLDGEIYVTHLVGAGIGAEVGAAVQFDTADFAPDTILPFERIYGVRMGIARIVVDPSNGFLVALSAECRSVDDPSSASRIVEYHPLTTQEVDCTVQSAPSIDRFGAVAATPSHELFVTDPATDEIHVFELPVATPPTIFSQDVLEIASQGARVDTQVAANLDDTTFHVEYGADGPCSANPCSSTAESSSIGASYAPQPGSAQLDELEPDTTYHFRVVATNGAGSVAGPDRSFRTFKPTAFDPSCDNNLARQQTGAAFLLDCRAYELVSAENQGGYNVASDLVSGQEPYGGFPRAKDKALYAVHNGGIPNTGNPTNRGPDPYVATRDAENERWVTEYVGIPSTAPSLQPFSSTLAGTDSSLSTFAFGGPEICDPCLPNGSAGVPLRLPDGSLIQGMQGQSIQVLDPEHSGEVKKPLSDDGTNFVFASKQQFVLGANHDGVNTTIYNRDLKTGITRIASKLPDTTVIQNGEDVVQLDLSADGGRTLIGNLIGTDSEGNRLFHLYMNSPIGTVDVTPGTTSGVLYAGMNEAGTRVFFTTPDPLVGDSDTSADLYMASVGSSPAASLTRVSTGTGGTGNTDSCDPAANSYNTEDWNVVPGGPTDCSVVAIGGKGGVAPENGTVYFLSPERLDGQGIDGAPNLFVARPGVAPKLVETLESSENEPLGDEAHLFKHSYGSFSYPEGVAIDADDGSVYVLDTIATTGPDDEGNFAPGAFVQKFDASGERDLTFGQDSKLDSTPFGPLLEAGQGFFGSPIGVATQIAVDNSSSPSSGSLYVPDVGNRAVYRFNPSGNFTNQIVLSPPLGLPPTGVGVNPANGNVHVTTGFPSGAVYTFGANGFPTAPTSFPVDGSPLGVALDSAGNSYVVNGEDTRVYGPTGTFIKVLDPEPSFGVSVDPTDDHVYVDRGNAVIEYDETGAEVATIGLGLLDESVSLGVHSGRMVVSNPSRGNVADYTEPLTPPDARYDSPMVLNGVRDPETRHTADFQTTPGGDYATFQSGRQITGFDNSDRYEVFRHDASGGETDCVSCAPTGAEPSTNASLPSNGLGITDDGRVFFNSGEALVLRDTNSRRDAYEWSEDENEGEGRAELVSTGQSPFDSGLLSVSADGTDAFFFTRETLAENDGNGNLMKLYTAREGGGFFKIPPEPPCAASDECHGPGSEPAPPIDLGTLKGSGGNAPQPKAEDNSSRCDTRKLARRARGFSRRAKALRRKATRSSNRRAGRRMRIRARRFAQGARKNATAAKRCRARTRARRAAR